MQTSMQIWQIVSIIVGVLGTMSGIFGVSAYFVERAKHKAKKMNDKEDFEQKKKLEEQRQLDQIKHTEYINEIKAVINDAIVPLQMQIEKMSKKMNVDTDGTITLLRDRMKCFVNCCKKQGWASSSDKANWNELYNSYAALGGNHFKEYVNEWKLEMESLPTEEVVSDNKKD